MCPPKHVTGTGMGHGKQLLNCPSGVRGIVFCNRRAAAAVACAGGNCRSGCCCLLLLLLLLPLPLALPGNARTTGDTGGGGGWYSGVAGGGGSWQCSRLQACPQASCKKKRPSRGQEAR